MSTTHRAALRASHAREDNAMRYLRGYMDFNRLFRRSPHDDAELCEAIGVSRRTLCRWRAAWHEVGRD